MGGILKITRAEFIKIFKKPSVYIMGLLLALIITISLFTFNPASSFTYDVNVTGTNVSEIYSKWSNGDIANYSKDELYGDITKSLNLIKYYAKNNERQQNISKFSNEIIDTTKELQALINAPAPNTSIINEKYTKIKASFQNLKHNFIETEILDSEEYFNIYINSTNFKQYYSQDTVEQGILNKIETWMNQSANSYVNYYTSNNIEQELQNIQKHPIDVVINEYLKNYEQKYSVYVDYINTTMSINPATARNRAADVKVTLDNIRTFINSISPKTTTKHVVLANEKELNNFTKFVDGILEKIDSVDELDGETVAEKHRNLIKFINSKKVTSQVTNVHNSIKIVNIDISELDKLRDTINDKILPILTSVEEEITNFVTLEGSSSLPENKAKINQLFTNYRTTTLTAFNLTNNSINIEAVKNLKHLQIITYKNFEDFNAYKFNEENTRYNYLIENKTFINDYSNVYSFNQNTSNKTSAFDFMFYGIKISSLIIIIFAIIMASNIMAYEFDTGTIKLLAIRPFKRYKILFGKLLAVMFFVLMFVLFSSIVSFAAGWSAYPIITSNMLVVFNSNLAFELSPILLMLINIVFITIEILFYAIIALSISTIFRSFATAMSTSLVILISTLVLNVIFGGSLWYSFIPFINADLFRFFGGAFNGNGSSFFNSLLSKPLLSNANFFMSASIYLGFMIIVLSICYSIFKKRDI